jgi:hypothetical protein
MRNPLNSRMDDKMAKILLIMICFLPICALGAEATPPDFMQEHSQFFQWILGGALLGNGFFIAKLIGNVDRQWKVIAGINTRLSHLEGEHVAIHRNDD